ncbi:MAG: hypothetical protein JWN53_899 [Gemmatimonadetes bacterium]|nr:hypothetical protein [Gemmatimonadota bacterium]
MTAILSHIRMRLAAVPLPRLRRLLLALYLLTAFADAAGKALAANSVVNDELARMLGPRPEAAELRAARPLGGNFEIFRASSRHLLAGENLYAKYPTEQDRFKYSPTFALLFAPLAWLWSPLALFLWSALNALLLFVAVEQVLPPRRALLALACLHLELLRAMQNGQSNALVAALIILAWVALERAQAWRAAAMIALGTCIKIFPLAALTFAIPRRKAIRTGLCALAVGVVLLLLPLLVTSPPLLMAQYQWWRGLEASDAQQRWFSVMELIQHWTRAGLPNWPVQSAGVLLLLAPLGVRRARWDEIRFRLLYLCSVLIFVALFNHQAERASYAIAFAGAAIWFASGPMDRWRTLLFGVAFLTMPVASTLVPGTWLKLPTVVLYRLAAPMLAIWIAVQVELWRSARGGAADGGRSALA